MPKTNRYRFLPEYQEGRNAFVEGERRGRNPYSASGDNDDARRAMAWWEGWDDEQEKTEQETEQ